MSRSSLTLLAFIGCVCIPAHAQLSLTSLSRSGLLAVSNTPANGVCVIERAESLAAEWVAAKNVFTTSAVSQVSLLLTGASGFYRAYSRNLANGREGFTNLTRAYGLLTTIAGAGGFQDFNNWRPEFEGAPATDVLLSGPHITMADPSGALYIADKDAHGIRKIQLDGTLITVAGMNEPGDGADIQTPATQVALNGPNGLWVRADGTLFILDTGNGKVRRRDTSGMMQTLFSVPGGILAGRGLWVSDDETLAYVSSLNTIKKWTRSGGVTDFSTGYSELGNLVIDPQGRLVVTDRGAHRVYRLDGGGNRSPLAGNGSTSGGGDGQLATATALVEPRAIWFLPSGAFFVGTHRGSQIWYVDTDGYIHLFLNGVRTGVHAGDGTWFYSPTEFRLSEVRAVTMDYDGNLIITENDVGFIRKIRFLPFEAELNR